MLIDYFEQYASYLLQFYSMVTADVSREILRSLISKKYVSKWK